MVKEDFDRNWEALSAEMLTGMKEWRLQHPRATLREIEEELSTRMARLQARLLQDITLASAAADLQGTAEEARPVCPQCGVPLQPRGKHLRKLQAYGGADVGLERDYAVCPHCRRGFFPPR
jgi:uncharacterized protein with PIN domain